MIIDLRSDTVTVPTPGMREAMDHAVVGDDVYKEDETVNLLENRLAAMFGKKRALFFPSGTMANQAAIKLHTRPGEALICDKYGHVHNYEGGGIAFNSGVTTTLVDGHQGMFSAAQAEAAIHPPDFYHSPKTSLITAENTTNKGGGSCWDVDELRAIRAVCDKHHLGYHLDGARLWNALVATGDNPMTFGNIFDTISVCLSKGLGCPVGSVLVGDDAIMEDAIRVRKVLGGGMRQIGILAAAGLYALDHHVERLAEDHQKAKDIEAVLNSCSYVKKIIPVQTNIVIFEVNSDVNANDLVNQLANNNIRISGMGHGKLRIVTHLDYTDQKHDIVLQALKTIQPK